MLMECVLSKEELTDQLRQFCQLIAQQVNLLLCMFNDTIDFNLIKAGKFVPLAEWFSPKAIFELVLKTFAH